jgi:hypothetical protein
LPCQVKTNLYGSFIKIMSILQVDSRLFSVFAPMGE